MKLVILGSYRYAESAVLENIIGRFYPALSAIVTGGANRGVEKLARDYARQHGIPLIVDRLSRSELAWAYAEGGETFEDYADKYAPLAEQGDSFLLVTEAGAPHAGYLRRVAEAAGKPFRVAYIEAESPYTRIAARYGELV